MRAWCGLFRAWGKMLFDDAFLFFLVSIGNAIVKTCCGQMNPVVRKNECATITQLKNVSQKFIKGHDELHLT